MSYIEFQDINKYFGQNHVLKGIDLSIEKGELLTLLGSSGCGKSTLLRCLAGLEPVQEGKIYLERILPIWMPESGRLVWYFSSTACFPI